MLAVTSVMHDAIAAIVPSAHPHPQDSQLSVLDGGTFISPIIAPIGVALMKTNFPELIIDMLRAAPNGLTSKDIAERLGTTAGNVSSRLSKLAAYGIISKARGALVSDGSRGTVYRPPSLEPQHRDRT
jgi:DNA-binding NarL/FixJ family response regulator